MSLAAGETRSGVSDLDRVFWATVLLAALVTSLRNLAWCSVPMTTGAWEDPMWLAQQDTLGFWSALLTPYRGYTHLFPRLAAALVAPLLGGTPARMFAFHLIGAIADGLCAAWIARVEFRKWIPDDRARVVLAVWIAAQPMAVEIPLAVTDVQWYLLWVGFLLTLVPTPAPWGARLVRWAGWWLIGLSAPGALALAPLILVAAARERGGARMFQLLCGVPLLVMVLVMKHADLGQPPRFPAAAEILRCLLWTATGPIVGRAEPFTNFGASTAVEVTAALLAAWSVGVVIVRGGAVARAWLAHAACALVLLVALACAGRPGAGANPEYTAGGRYFFVPVAILGMLHAIAWSVAPGRLGRISLAPAVIATLPATAASLKIRL